MTIPLFLLANKKSYPLEDGVPVSELREKILDSGLKITKDNLAKIKIRAEDLTGHGFTKNIKIFLDYIDDDNYFLDQGKWSHFNQDYLKFLFESIDQLAIVHEGNLNYKQANLGKFLKTLSQEEKEKWYAEKYFNEMVAVKSGFESLDRDFLPWGNNKIEVCDLLKDNEIYAVKIGQPQKLCYAIDQSLTSLKYIQQNKKAFVYEGRTIKPQKIGLWLILERKRELKQLSEIRSIIFLMKLNDWRKKVNDAGFEPIVRVNYKV